MSTTEKRAVKFLQAWRGYSKGEIAGFDENVAVQLVKSKVAEEYTDDGDSTTQTPAKPPAQRQQASSKRGKTETQAPAPAPAQAEGSAPSGLADPPAGTAGPAAPAGSADAAAGSADNTDRP